MEKLRHNKQQGFTLIEVLVAGFILIIVISTMTFVYRTAVISSIKASNSVKLSGSVDLIISNIKNTIRNGNTISPLAKSGKVAEVTYQWQTHLLANKAAPARLNAESGTSLAQPKRFYLWQVDLTLKYQTLTKRYQFKEISWQNFK